MEVRGRSWQIARRVERIKLNSVSALISEARSISAYIRLRLFQSDLRDHRPRPQPLTIITPPISPYRTPLNRRRSPSGLGYWASPTALVSCLLPSKLSMATCETRACSCPFPSAELQSRQETTWVRTPCVYVKAAKDHEGGSGRVSGGECWGMGRHCR